MQNRLAGHIFVGVLFIAAAAGFVTLSDASGDVAAARRLYLRGNYEEAAEAFGRLAEKTPVAAALGLARCRAAVGKNEEAEKTLATAATKHPTAAELKAVLAELAFGRGDYPTAEKLAGQALKLDEKQPLARWLAAELHRVAGRLDEAAKAYEWFVDFYNATDKIEDPDALWLIGLAEEQSGE